MTAPEKIFESQKNRKAFTYTIIVLGILLLAFFLISWKNMPPAPPVTLDLIELNLGNNEEGWGQEQPLIKGEMSPSQEAPVQPQQSAKAPEPREENITPSDDAEETAAPVTKTVKATKPTTKPANNPSPNPAPKPQKPKITYNGPGNGNGNNASQDNGYTMQGNNRNGRGDAGDPSGHPDSYGNTPGGKVGGPRVTSGNRKVIRYYSFTADLKKATIYAQIKVSPQGSGTLIRLVKPSTSFDAAYATAISGYLRNMQFDKAADESTVTVQFNFTVN